MSSSAGFQAVTRKPGLPFRVSKRIVRRGRPQVFHVRKKSSFVVGRLIAVSSRKRYHPASAFRRQNESSPPIVRRLGKYHHSFPIRWRVVGNPEHRGAITNVHADRRFRGRREACRSEEHTSEL